MMNPGEAVSSQKIHIVSQFFRITASLHKSDDAAASLTMAVDQLRQLFPDRILAFPLSGIRKGTGYHKLYFFFHAWGHNGYRIRRQIGRRQGKRFYGC